MSVEQQASEWMTARMLFPASESVAGCVEVGMTVKDVTARLKGDEDVASLMPALWSLLGSACAEDRQFLPSLSWSVDVADGALKIEAAYFPDVQARAAA